MKATQPRHPDHLMSWRRPRFDGSSIRSIFVERVVNSVLVIVGDVIADEPAQMAFAQRDDVIKNLTPRAADPALRDPVLPRCSDARALGFQTCVIQESDHVGIEFRIVVEDSVAVRPGFSKCLA